MATIVAPTGLTDTLLPGTSADDYIYGAQGKDTLLGYAGNDYLDGGSGIDSLIGGTGNDTYIIDGVGDIVVENANEGVDGIWTTFDVDLTSGALGGYLANIENLTLTGQAGTTSMFGRGNALNNAIIGSAFKDTLDGDSGNDTLDGRGGNDTISGGSGGDSIIGDVGNDWLMGDSGGDTLVGGIGNDCLVGGSEADSMAGGSGNDSYYVDNTGDVVTESASQGTDVIFTSVDYTIPANIDALVLTGSGNISATGGNVTNDSLVGNEGDNSLTGLGGNDTLMGGAIIKNTTGGNDDTLGGDDTLLGGDGNDSLIGGPGVDSLVGGLGNDTYEVSFDSRVTVTDTAALLALTSAQVSNGDFVFQYDPANPALSILWNVVDINNVVPGLRFTNSGRSPFVSTDVILENAAQGTDLVKSSATYTLGANLENLTLIGSDNVSGTGNAQDNVLTGNIGNNSLDGDIGNDTLDGSAGSDTLIGGAGDDYYILNSETEDTTIEALGGGTDTVQTSVNFSLLTRPTFAQIESLVLTGTAIMGKGNNPVAGVGGNNVITGNAQDNQLSGLGGADTLYGGVGSDIVDGGTQNDILIGGTNTLFGGTDTDTLNGNDQLLGGDGSDSLDGGFGNDVLKGGNGGLVGLVGTGDSLLGGDGNDLLLGGTNATAGATDRETALTFWNDTLVGGTGNDTLDGGNGTNSLIGGLGDDLVYIRSGADIAVELPGEGNDTLTSNVNLDLSIGTNYANFETATLFGQGNVNLTGNNESNILVGNNGANVITGNEGNDTILGGAGLDYLRGDDVAGVQSGNDCLDGGTSASPAFGDTMDGGLGNDTFVVDNIHDWLIEANPADDELDTVRTYVNFDPLPGRGAVGFPNGDPNNVTRSPSFANLDIASFANIENFVLLENSLGLTAIRGVGNAKGNEFTGNTENNVILGLGGDDTLLGNDGNDSLFGDADYGDPATQLDRYATPATAIYDPVSGVYPFNPGAYANDVAGLQDADPFGDPSVPLTTIQTQQLIDPTYAGVVGTAVEGYFDSLVGGAGNDVLSGQGQADTLIGGDGNDCLVGGTGDDSMVGGAGNDTFFMDNFDDAVVEESGEGTDQLRSSVNIYRLQDNVENLIIYGNGLVANLGVGNDLNNVIEVAQLGAAGPYASDVAGVTLSGGVGNDSLYGYSFWERDPLSQTTPYDYFERIADDYLIGGEGNDWVDGGQNIVGDTLAGGLGNDTLVVDSLFDEMLEFNNEGTDLVVTTIDLDLSDTAVAQGMFVENLTLFGPAGPAGVSGTWPLQGAGNRLDNFITGNKFGNFLDGEAGMDTILGGDSGGDSESGGKDSIQGGLWLGAAGVDDGARDSLVGGDGNDTYVLQYMDNILGPGQPGDIIFDSGGEHDVIESWVTYDLFLMNGYKVTGVEDLTLAGTGNIDAIGDNGDNVLTGNSGDNQLVGMSGNDSLRGMAGDDTLFGDGGNDTLNGGTGTDILFGGKGNDLFLFDDPLPVLGTIDGGTDADGKDIDKILFTTKAPGVTFTAADFANVTNVEALEVTSGNNSLTLDAGNKISSLTGGNGNDTFDAGLSGAGTDLTIDGAAGNDSLIGGAANDSITGNSGSDFLDGGTGVDTLMGGSGNDTLIGITADVTNGEKIDGGDGVDTILTSTDFFSLETTSGIEKLVLLGGGGLTAEGKAASNDQIFGTGAGDTISGLSGDDSLWGNGGNDSIIGGDGADTLCGTSAALHGAAEMDTLTGGKGADVFILGDSANPYYAGPDLSQYAVITDFDRTTASVDAESADTILLKPFASAGGNFHGYIIGGDIYGIGAGVIANSYLYQANHGGAAVAGDLLIAAIQATGGTGAGGALTTADLTTAVTFA